MYFTACFYLSLGRKKKRTHTINDISGIYDIMLSLVSIIDARERFIIIRAARVYFQFDTLCAHKLYDSTRNLGKRVSF